MEVIPFEELPRKRRYRLILHGLARSLGICVVLTVAYFLAPLDHLNKVPLVISLTIGMLALAGVSVQQVRAVLRARYPGIRATQALATMIPLFLLLFAACYFLAAGDATTNFNVESLTKIDALYFTVTVFSTVGFGDITAISGTARMLVSVQMLLDLVVLGLVVRQFMGAVQSARDERLAEVRAAAVVQSVPAPVPIPEPEM
ncbi:MAG TPA: potassium channel family protein [Mycobacterium sp.]|nr:potassium channel family protein [Mycobacterium sp.]